MDGKIVTLLRPHLDFKDLLLDFKVTHRNLQNSLVDGVAVQGDLIPIDTDEVARLDAEFNIENAKTVAKQYLKDTDWYTARKVDSDIAIPADIRALRQQARIDSSS